MTGVRVWSSCFRVQVWVLGVGFRFWGSGFRVQTSGFMFCEGLQVSGFIRGSSKFRV